MHSCPGDWLLTMHLTCCCNYLPCCIQVQGHPWLQQAEQPYLLRSISFRSVRMGQLHFKSMSYTTTHHSRGDDRNCSTAMLSARHQCQGMSSVIGQATPMKPDIADRSCRCGYQCKIQQHAPPEYAQLHTSCLHPGVLHGCDSSQLQTALSDELASCGSLNSVD